MTTQNEIESVEEFRKHIIEELNRMIGSLRILGKHRQADILERWKHVFMERNFEVLPDGTVRYR